MRVVTLVRKPLSEANVASNCAQHGTGGLNLDGCRIGTFQFTTPSGFDRYNARNAELGYRPSEYSQGVPPISDAIGRWPANILLQHTPECVQTGMREVQSDGHFPASRPVGSQVSGPSGHKGQVSLDERVTRGEYEAMWDCAPSCPIGKLTEGKYKEGTAARFFKQVGGKACLSTT